MNNINILDSFDTDSLPDLDIVVMGALELFGSTSLLAIDKNQYSHPLVVGSGNAEATGRILFEDVDAVFASESNYLNKLQSINSIDGVVLISASGGKHAPIIASSAIEMGKKVTLLTNTPDSPAGKILSNISGCSELILPKNREPYTYNTSTYLGMILASTNESSSSILDYITTNTAHVSVPDMSTYDKYYLIVPARFSGIIRMLQIKFIELFGRNISVTIETDEYVRHATTVAPASELFVSFGSENTTWGESANRLFIPLPTDCGYAAMMCIGYYFVAQIQKSYPELFKDNIVEYCKKVSGIFDESIQPIVPGN
jgi:hypothetical protein